MNVGWRWMGLVCASTSIGALLAQFYGVASMRLVAGAVFLPARALLAVLGVAALERLAQALRLDCPDHQTSPIERP
jgi:hypothetical protein